MIAFAFTFPGGRYHATPWGRHTNEADVAWPPEPVRILRAMIATWWRKGDHVRFAKSELDGLIETLAKEAPMFRLPEAVHSHVRAFMPAPTDKKLIYDAFLRFDPAAELIVAWPNVELTESQLDLAAHLLDRIGYLGRAESWADGRIASDWDGEVNACPRISGVAPPEGSVPIDVTVAIVNDDWHEVRTRLLATAAASATSKTTLLRATLPERLSDALAVDTSEWQKAGWSSPPPLRRLIYDRPAFGPLPTHAIRRTSRPVRPHASPEVARFVLAGRPQPRVEETLRIAELARWALMSGDGQPPPEISGRNAQGPLRADPSHAHAFYLPEDSDGDGLIDHLVIYCRTGFSDEARRRLDHLTRLWLVHGRPDADGERGRKEWRLALEGIGSPQAFSMSSLLGSARTWISVTPLLKSRFDKRRPAGFEALVKSYQAQIEIEWKRRSTDIPAPVVQPLTDPSAPTRFAAPIGSGGTLRSTLAFNRTRSGRGGQQPDAAGGFFQLTFDRLIDGPVSLGWGAHFGLGLFRRVN